MKPPGWKPPTQMIREDIELQLRLAIRMNPDKKRELEQDILKLHKRDN